MKLFTIELNILLLVIFTSTLTAQDTPKRSPELQVLDRFVGTWDLEITVKPPGQESTTFDLVSHRRWSKGGTFVVFEEPGPEEVILPITYDPESKTYPGTIMIGASHGLVTGTWDEDNKTMCFAIEYTNKSTYKGEHRFIRKDYAEASGTVTDPNGKVVVELSWKQTRRK